MVDETRILQLELSGVPNWESKKPVAHVIT